MRAAGAGIAEAALPGRRGARSARPDILAKPAELFELHRTNPELLQAEFFFIFRFGECV